ncbi:MAG: tRNA (adenosine(37)-N6)-dimethylallyltransferase MiaA [Candidatus Omnitrophica bacterium]|nr:tRNA (adenosine(37)-N6)-dimethylallyltransferase MiaA [Candidatus Omnitrophota bacterium]MCM8793151.1 tRNA (adenosine(37)-N6)-dimethylallyltransferase MiaA [Candidatus Omnitrophota bacterium]
MALIVFLVGPTAVGKTALSLRLAPLINAEIVSCDSMQVYKGIEIANSKPLPEERKIVRHYMLDVVSPDKEYSVADYRREALSSIEEIRGKGKIPLIVGGSGLYFKSLLDGIFAGPSRNQELRENLYSEAKLKGVESLYERLKDVDPEIAKRIHPHDLRRIIRALEVYSLTGTPISILQKKTAGLALQHQTVIYGLMRSRSELYRRINERVEKMFTQGLVEEIKNLKKLKITPIAQQCLGYREISAYLEGKLTIAEAKELLKKATRQFARRQLIWFRRDKRISWINLDKETDLDTLAEELAKQIKQLII